MKRRPRRQRIRGKPARGAVGEFFVRTGGHGAGPTRKTWQHNRRRAHLPALAAPSDAVASIRHHVHPEKRHNPIIHLLNLAAGAAEHRCFGLPGEDVFWKFTPEHFAKAGLNKRQFQPACERAQRHFSRLHSVVG